MKSYDPYPLAFPRRCLPGNFFNPGGRCGQHHDNLPAARLEEGLFHGNGAAIREQRIPLTLEYPQPNAETQESISDSLAMEKEGTSRFKNAQDMFDDLRI